MRPQDIDRDVEMLGDSDSSDDPMASDEHPIQSSDEDMDSDEVPEWDSDNSKMGSDEMPIRQAQGETRSESDSSDAMDSDERPESHTDSESGKDEEPLGYDGGYDDDDFGGPEVSGVG